jgi:hypothetical protein
VRDPQVLPLPFWGNSIARATDFVATRRAYGRIHTSVVSSSQARALLFFRHMREQRDQHDHAGLPRDPEDWKTGEEPMTPAQRSYLETLSRDVGETFDENLTKAEASKKIDELRERSPRVADE